MIRIAINGFGRIGRLVARAVFESGRDDIELVAINTTASYEASAHLLRYDSVHGVFQETVTIEGDYFVIKGKKIRLVQHRDPQALPWKALDIDVVFECSGKFTKRADAEKHLDAGARKILISAPASDEDCTIVYGVNHDQLKPEHRIVSNASCTTNCLAPVAFVLNRTVGLTHGLMTTIHSYTKDQHTVDSAHKDLYRARAAGLSMIPTSTGAARAIGKVLPELAGKLDGTSIRVPTPNVSAVDLTFTTARATTVQEINAAFQDAEKGDLKNILRTCTEPLVSIDFNHTPHSSIVALKETKVIGNTLARILAWYDNEWAFALRMLDTASLMKS